MNKFLHTDTDKATCTINHTVSKRLSLTLTLK